jgi:hypothetical protein
MLRMLIYVTLLPLVAMAQAVPEGVKYDLTDLTYPRVARLARIQGVVKLELTQNEAGQQIKIVSGNKYLAPQASDNLAKWRTNQPITVNFIFRLADPDISKKRVPKGDAFDRMILRTFHLATYTEEYSCKQSSDKLVEPKVVQESPLILDVEFVGGTNCLQTETSLVASR